MEIQEVLFFFFKKKRNKKQFLMFKVSFMEIQEVLFFFFYLFIYLFISIKKKKIQLFTLKKYSTKKTYVHIYILLFF